MTTPFIAPVSRREMLRRTALGFGTIGLAGTMQTAGLLGATRGPGSARSPALHLRPRAKRVIYLFMNGGPSHVDTFDPKPALKEHEGKPPELKRGNRKTAGGDMPPPLPFR